MLVILTFQDNYGDDFYADILNDDIVELDETPTSQHNPFITSQPFQSTITCQGTASRRIKLNRKTIRAIQKYPVDKKGIFVSSWRKIRNQRPVVSVIFVFLVLLLLLLMSIKGSCSEHMERITYANLYRMF